MNLFAISIGFLVAFTAYNAVQNLESSINSNMGTASVTVVYASLSLSSLFLPTIVVRKIGPKWTMVISLAFYSTYIIANFYPSWYTLIPTAAMLGAAGATLWTAQAIYVTDLSKKHARRIGDTASNVISKFFGFFWMAFQTGGIWGNLLTYYILQTHDPSEEGRGNSTSHCGAQYCNENIFSATNKPPSKEQIYILVACFVACAFLAVFLVAAIAENVVMDQLLTADGEEPPPDYMSKAVNWDDALATFRFMRDNTDLKLLIPFTVYLGIHDSFLAGDFTRDYVSCSWDVAHVGFVMMCYGAVDAVTAMVTGQMVKYVSQAPLILLGMALNMATFIAMFLWVPHPDAPMLYYVMVSVWAIADGIYQTQLQALYGVLFSYEASVEAAFSSLSVLRSLGYIIGFGYSSYLCTYVKLYILVATCILSLVGYIMVEVRRRKKLTGKPDPTVVTKPSRH